MPGPGSLYDEDFVRWSEEQAGAIRAASASGTNLPLDWENLAEEIESLGRSHRAELASRTRTLIEHLLKLEHSAATFPKRGWSNTVDRTRLEIDDLVKVSPSLRRELADVVEEVTASASRLAARALDREGEIEAAMRLSSRQPYRIQEVFGPWFPDDPPRSRS